MPKEAQQHADSIVLGDAETVWCQVVEDARRRKLKKLYQGPPGVGQLDGTLPRRDIYQGKGYLPISLMQFSRGCRFTCQFCAVSQYFGRTHYVRRIEEVVREIESLEPRIVFFVDDNIASDQKSLKELCRALIPLKIKWVSQASIDITRDDELMRLLADSGCMGNVVGFETLSRESLRETKKSPNLPRFARYAQEVKVLREHGMQTWASFTLGYDHDTREGILETLEFALENRFTFAAFNILIPYPNTPLYERLLQEGRLLYDGQWWLHPEYRFNHAAFTPKLMTPEELTELCHTVRTKFNSVPSLLRRFSDIKTNLRTLRSASVYWRYTTLYRKEVHKKHGMLFGLK